MKINLQIERLILDETLTERVHAPLVQAAVEAELARLLAQDSLSSALLAGGSLPELPNVSVQLPAPTGPANLGQQIAGAVHSRIGNVSNE